jgi:hypothetical protein
MPMTAPLSPEKIAALLDEMERSEHLRDRAESEDMIDRLRRDPFLWMRLGPLIVVGWVARAWKGLSKNHSDPIPIHETLSDDARRARLRQSLGAIRPPKP